MGTSYTFKCNKCNYSVGSSGKMDYGMEFVVSPHICNDCDIVTDVIVGMQGLCFPKEWLDNPKKHDIPEYMVEMRYQFYNCEKCEGENLSDWDSDTGECPKCDGKLKIDKNKPSVNWD